MLIFLRLLVTFSLLMCIPSHLGAQDQHDGDQQLDRTVYFNQHGAPVAYADGSRINYTKSDFTSQAANSSPFVWRGDEAVAAADLGLDERAASPQALAILPVWGYAAFGSRIGQSNIVISENQSHTEIYVGGSASTFGLNNFWHALRFDSTTGEYRQVYVSPSYAEGIRRIEVDDVIGDSEKEIVVALDDGRILIHHLPSKFILSEFDTAAINLRGMKLSDIDQDGAIEIIVCTGNHLYVYAGDGQLEWDLGVGGQDLEVGQFDTDTALEVAVTDGTIVDGSSHTAQWTWPGGFGSVLDAADIDSDGMEELIVAERWSFVWSYDVDLELPKWSIPIVGDIGAIHVGDIDGDLVYELLVGEGQWGSVIAFDTVTQQEEWSIANPEHGVTDVAIGDVDGDGITELLWGAGATSSGEDHLYVVDWMTEQFEWQNVHLDGPFLGPEMGDLDGDTNPEIVMVSWESDSGYGSGRILVFGPDLRLRAMSDPIVEGNAWTGTHDLELIDVDNDGRLEILVAADSIYDGVIEIYNFEMDNSFNLNWTNATRPDAAFYSVQAADVDGDGEMEIVGGGGDYSGHYVYVYDYATGNEEWHSLHMGDPQITGLELVDLDSDNSLEIVGMLDGGDIYIFDGATKVLEDILYGEFTSLLQFQAGSNPLLLVGDNAGDLAVIGYFGSYMEVYRDNFISEPVDGITRGPGGASLWVGSEGTLKLVTPTETIWESPNYGTVFGEQTLFYPGLPFFLSAGTYSLHGFWAVVY